MGYFDTVKEADLGRKTMIDAQSQKQTLNKLNSLKPHIDQAIIDASKEGVKAGAAAMWQDMRGVPVQSQQPALGISQDTAEHLGGNALMQKASSIVDQLDLAQEQGAPPSELAKIYKSLEPNLQKAVEQIKLQKNSQQTKNLPGSAVERINSPITKSAKDILAQTQIIGQH